MCARFPCCSHPLLLLTVRSEQIEADSSLTITREHKVNDPHSDIISLIWCAKAIENPSFFVHARRHSLVHAVACSLQIPGDCVSFAGVKEPLSICGRLTGRPGESGCLLLSSLYFSSLWREGAGCVMKPSLLATSNEIERVIKIVNVTLLQAQSLLQQRWEFNSGA